MNINGEEYVLKSEFEFLEEHYRELKKKYDDKYFSSKTKNKRINYINKYFTKKGYETLYNYLKTLTSFYFEKKPEDYPFKIGIIFGIPFFEGQVWDREFKNVDELVGRLKNLMQVLWVSNVSVKIGSSIKVFEFEKV